MVRLAQFGCGVSSPQYSRVMLTVIPMGDLRRILSLKVRIAQKRIRVREKERESTMDAVEATILGLKTKSGLRPYSRYKAGLYTGEAATYKVINRMVQIQVQSRIQATGKRGRVINKEKDKCKSEQGFKGGKGQ